MKKLRDLYKETSKISFVVYIVLRLFVIICMVRELMHGNIENALLCVLSLILFLLPVYIEKTFKIDLPTPLEVIILIFIFSAEILGEINNFYGMFHNFDDILHTINGFLAASVGFSLIYLFSIAPFLPFIFFFLNVFFIRQIIINIRNCVFFTSFYRRRRHIIAERCLKITVIIF